jgi:hypothetical protein
LFREGSDYPVQATLGRIHQKSSLVRTIAVRRVSENQLQRYASVTRRGVADKPSTLNVFCDGVDRNDYREACLWRQTAHHNVHCHLFASTREELLVDFGMK